MQQQVIYTIGHSTHSIYAFIALLQQAGIGLLADVRSFPGSKRLPQFNQSALSAALAEAGIQYLHIPALGGKANASDGYRSYMQTDVFKQGIKLLQERSMLLPVAYMCAEADWKHCHRSLISDHLKAAQWQVLHIGQAGSITPHPDRYFQAKLF